MGVTPSSAVTPGNPSDTNRLKPLSLSSKEPKQGAYRAMMSWAYDARPVTAEVVVDGSDWSLIRERESHADLCRGERVPHWLK